MSEEIKGTITAYFNDPALFDEMKQRTNLADEFLARMRSCDHSQGTQIDMTIDGQLFERCATCGKTLRTGRRKGSFDAYTDVWDA